MPAGGPGRARRLSAAGPMVPLQGRVPEATRRRANTAADALGVSLGRYLEYLVERDPLNDEGRPIWAAEVGLTPDPTETLPGLEGASAA
jgi:hypothetical protein